jgi:hypothetical protein
MVGDPRDKGAYQMAVAAVGCALIVVLAGVCVIIAVGKEVPQELWSTASALGGGLLGILAPSPSPSTASTERSPLAGKSWFVRGLVKVGRGLVILGKDLWSNRAIVILLAVFGVSVAFGVAENSSSLQALAGASGGVLVGMLVPSPAKKDQ